MQGYYRLGAQNSTRDVRVRRVFGAVANYGTPLSDEPVIFLKPAESIIWAGEQVRIPRGETAIFEGELVVAIGKAGRYITTENAMAYVAAYGAGLDMTLERFRKNREEGVPWMLAKGFDTSTCLSDFASAADVKDYTSLSVELLHNGEQKQSGSLADLVTPVQGLISFISRFMELLPGDLIFTGTPAGAAAVEPGDELTVRVPGVAEATFSIAEG